VQIDGLSINPGTSGVDAGPARGYGAPAISIREYPISVVNHRDVPTGQRNLDRHHGFLSHRPFYVTHFERAANYIITTGGG
jgi:hypothetical protein